MSHPYQSSVHPPTVYIDPAWKKVVPGWSRSHPTTFRSSRAINVKATHNIGGLTTSVPILRTQASYSPIPSTTPSTDTPPTSSPSTPSNSRLIYSTKSYDEAFPSLLGQSSKSGTIATSKSKVRPEQVKTKKSLAGKERSTGTDLSLDKYAATYRPFWLRSLPAPALTLTLPPKPPFPPPYYTQPIYTPRPRLISPQDSILAAPPYTQTPVPLESERATAVLEYYTTHFTALLSLHLVSLLEEAEAATLLSVPLHIQSLDRGSIAGVQNIYRIQIPGIREDLPRLNNGDHLVLRGLYPVQQAASNTAIEAEVVGLVKVAGWVYIKAPQLAQLDASLPKVELITRNGDVEDKAMVSMYRVEFKVSATPVCAMQDAVRSFGSMLAAPSNTSSRPIAHRWLFPDILDVPHVAQSYDHRTSLDVDETLNKEQREAVRTIAAEKSAKVPYLISGPPGVSKTKTLVAAALQILLDQPHAVILLCAPSNPAADTLVQRLGRVLKANEMLRLNPPSRTFAEVPDDVLRFCFVENDTFHIPAFSALMNFRVIVTTCLDAAILVFAHATNADTMSAEYDLACNLHPGGTGQRTVITPHWTHLLVDEAGQGSEPEILIPLSVVLPPVVIPENMVAQEPLVVLCGDIHQLGPIIPSPQARDAELDISLLERLFQRPVYATHPKARTKSSRLLEQTLQEMYKPPFTNLCRNYRSIAPILMVPAALFYEDTLQPAATDVQLIEWSGLGNPKIPILFRGCETDEDWIEEGASWYNAGEIALVIETIQSILSERPEIRQEEIAVITPWREQVWRTRARLRQVGLRGVDVGNVEAYQGREFRITIISCVRSRSRFLGDDRKANMGLYNERKRFNVSITRAKELLVVIGNANLLKGDSYWNGFLQVMLRNNLYRGPDVDMELTGAYMSKLESELRYNQDVTRDDQAMTLAGAMANAMLGD